MKIGDQFIGVGHSVIGTVWEIVKEGNASGISSGICLIGNDCWKAGRTVSWGWGDTNYFKPYYSKSNNFKEIYNILNEGEN